MFALAIQSVVGIGNDIGIEGFDLLDESMADGLQERLDRINNMFPGLSRLGARGFVNRRGNHFGISR